MKYPPDCVWGALPPAISFAPSFVTDLDVAEVLLQLGLRDGGTHLHSLFRAVAHAERLGPVHQHVSELLLDRLVDYDPAGGRARLPREPEGALRDDLDRVLELRVGQDDCRVLPAHLELNPRHLAGVGPRLLDSVSDLVRTRERDAVDVLVDGELLPDRPARAGDEIQDAGRETRAFQGRDELRGDSRGQRRWLEDDSIPGYRAGAIFHEGIAIGKFQGVIRETTSQGFPHRVEQGPLEARGIGPAI